RDVTDRVRRPEHQLVAGAHRVSDRGGDVQPGGQRVGGQLSPHDVDVGALCRAYHVESRQIEAGDLAAALDESFDGMRVLEV
ncbi:hypothetical protein C6A85_13450, partial [Mycobacterium sp. ITM-2017-0098]